MLIRIGDEKRELIDSHLGVLMTKLSDVKSDEIEEVLETFSTVLTNMPHKVSLYASIVGLLRLNNHQIAEQLINHILQKTLPKIFNQKCFECRNIFRWLGYLVDLNVLAQDDASKFFE